MKQHKDRAIILSRIDYGERDRILTLLCLRLGKVSVLAKGVRSQKSRLAGGIELLSESDVSLVEGRSNMMTLTSARLHTHFGELVKDMTRMQRAFAHIKAINSIADGRSGQEYYPLLATSLTSLNNPDYDPRIVDIWFNLHILHLSGSQPNLRLETAEVAEAFEFDHDRQQFISVSDGAFTKDDLKILRLCMVHPKPPRIQNELGSEDRLQSLTQTLLRTNATEL